MLTTSCPLSLPHSWHESRGYPPLSPGAEGEHRETGTDPSACAEANSSLARVRWGSLVVWVILVSPSPQPFNATSAGHIQKVLRCKGGSAETLSLHKGGSLPKEHVRFALGSPMQTFLCCFLPCPLVLGWGHLMLTQLFSSFLFTRSFGLNRL